MIFRRNCIGLILFLIAVLSVVFLYQLFPSTCQETVPQQRVVHALERALQNEQFFSKVLDKELGALPDSRVQISSNLQSHKLLFAYSEMRKFFHPELSLRFVGCYEYLEPDFQENWHTPATDGVYWKMKQPVLRDCAIFCTSRNYDFTTISGSLCMCSSVMFSTKILNYSCDLPCYDIHRFTCGGLKSIAVYDQTSIRISKANNLVKFTACLSHVPKALGPSSPLVSIEQCVAKCEILRKLFAAVYNSTCFCLNFSNNLRLSDFIAIEICESNRCDYSSSQCSDKGVSFYRTDISMDFCLSKSFSDKPRNFVAITSFPGSGNTWIRHVIEMLSGLYTGSIYNDQHLFAAGFLGENESWASVRVFGVKTHEFSMDAINQFAAAILIIRNPYDAILSEFHRQHGGHLGFADEKLFESKDWDDFVLGKARTWLNTAMLWLSYGRGTVIIYYEDILDSPALQFRKISEAFGLVIDDSRVLCAVENSHGHFKRDPNEKSKINIQIGDPFNEDMHAYIDIYIKQLSYFLKQNNMLPLPTYYLPEKDW